MALTFWLRDAVLGRRARIDKFNALHVSQTNVPLDIDDGARVFGQFLTSTGLASGSNDMRVNGSVTPQTFFISAIPGYDVFLKTVSFLISDVGAALNNFGALAVLTNGCTFSYEDSEGDVVIQSAIKTNFDMIRMSGGEPAFGTGTAAFQAQNAVASLSDAYFPVFDFQKMCGFSQGIKLKSNTKQRLKIIINDNLSVGIDVFNCFARGIQVKRT